MQGADLAADLAATRLEKCKLANDLYEEANTYRTPVIGSDPKPTAQAELMVCPKAPVDGSRPEIFLGHTNWVLGVSVIDQNTVVSASGDNTLKIWDLTTGETTMTSAHLPNSEWVSFTHFDFLAYSRDSWRWAGWLIPAERGRLTRWPPEAIQIGSIQ